MPPDHLDCLSISSCWPQRPFSKARISAFPTPSSGSTRAADIGWLSIVRPCDWHESLHPTKGLRLAPRLALTSAWYPGVANDLPVRDMPLIEPNTIYLFRLPFLRPRHNRSAPRFMSA